MILKLPQLTLPAYLGVGFLSLPGMTAPPHTMFLPQITAEDHHCRGPPGAGDTRGGAPLPGRLQAQGRDQGEAEGDPAQRPDGGDG